MVNAVLETDQSSVCGMTPSEVKQISDPVFCTRLKNTDSTLVKLVSSMKADLITFRYSVYGRGAFLKRKSRKPVLVLVSGVCSDLWPEYADRVCIPPYST